MPSPSWSGPRWLFFAFQAYSPATHGRFIFDDAGQPFSSPSYAASPFLSWVTGVRPLLMLSYWINYQISGTDVTAYHSTNVFLHVLNALLVFLICQCILTRLRVDSAMARLAAAGAGGVFLLHPIQTEAVAYVSGRSEVLSALFVLAAILVFVRQPADTISWKATVLILLLYAVACMAKEQAAVLPVALLLIDLLVSGRGVRESLKSHARLYGGAALAGAVAGAGILIVLQNAKTAGFRVSGILWYEYLFSQFRVVFLYIRLFFLPVHQNADYDIAVSRSLTDHGSIWWLAVLLLLLAAAWRYRLRFPLAAYGFLIFLVFLAPTSSVLPIKDLAAERRMYLPLFGLLLCCLQVASRVRERSTLAWGTAAVLFMLGTATYERSKLWADPVRFWEEIVSESPGKERAYTYLITEYLHAHRCSDALAVATKAPADLRDRPEFLIDSGAAFECALQPNRAIANYKRAATVAPSAANYLVLAHAYRRLGHPREAESALNEALQRGITTAYERDLLNYYQNPTRARTR